MVNVSNVRRGARSGAQASDEHSAPEPEMKKGILIVSDATGRRIGVRRLSALDKMRLFRVIGSENAANDRYLGLAIIAASVAEIDGEDEPFPVRASQVEALIGQLDDVGTDAVTAGMAQLYGTSADEELATAKK